MITTTRDLQTEVEILQLRNQQLRRTAKRAIRRERAAKQAALECHMKLKGLELFESPAWLIGYLLMLKQGWKY